MGILSTPLEPELEEHFRRYLAGGADPDSLSEILLGDPAYVQLHRMPKYNGPVDALGDAVHQVERVLEESGN